MALLQDFERKANQIQINAIRAHLDIIYNKHAEREDRKTFSDEEIIGMALSHYHDAIRSLRGLSE